MSAEGTTFEKRASAGFVDELRHCGRQLDNKLFFAILFGAWAVLFSFLGNSTFGYVDTPSLFNWMYKIYTRPDGDDGHGLMIPAIFLGLLWWKRTMLLGLRREVWWPASIMLAAAMAMHVLGYVIQQPRVSIAAFFIGLYALVGLTWGREWLKATFLYFALFVFCIPLGGLEIMKTITVPLRIFSAGVTAFIAKVLLGLKVVHQGTQILRADGSYSYEVNAACSGIRSLISLFVLMSVYGLVFYRSPWKRIGIIVFSVPLAVFCNVLRLVAVIVAGEAFGPKAGETVHNWSGFFTYTLAVVCMFAISHFWREPAPESEKPGGRS